MGSFTRILTVIEANRRGEQVLRRAIQLARFHGATLGVAGVVDYTPGYESDHVPFLTPRQMKAAMAEAYAGKLKALLERTDAQGHELMTAAGPLKDTILDMAASWRPDLIVMDAHDAHSLEGLRQQGANKQQGAPWDMLLVNLDPPSWKGRFVNAMSMAFC